MKSYHVLWRVKNGWIRTPDHNPNFDSSVERGNMFVFDNLRQFCDYFVREEANEKQEEKKNEKPK